MTNSKSPHISLGGRKGRNRMKHLNDVNLTIPLPIPPSREAKLPKPEIWDEVVWNATLDVAEALYIITATRERLIPFDFASKTTQDKYIRWARVAIKAYYRSLEMQRQQKE